MSKRAKQRFRVLQPITKQGRQREAGYEFTAGADGEHVKRWLKAGKIELATLWRAPRFMTPPDPTRLHGTPSRKGGAH